MDRITVNGAAGNDIISVALAGGVIQIVDTTPNVAIFHSQAANDQLVIKAATGDDTINAAASPGWSDRSHLNGNDTLIGSQGNDTILGGGGNDVLLPSAAWTRFFGGAGLDTFILRHQPRNARYRCRRESRRYARLQRGCYPPDRDRRQSQYRGRPTVLIHRNKRVHRCQSGALCPRWLRQLGPKKAILAKSFSTHLEARTPIRPPQLQKAILQLLCLFPCSRLYPKHRCNLLVVTGRSGRAPSARGAREKQPRLESLDKKSAAST